MKVSGYIGEAVERASMVRQMFDEGLRLKALHGPDKVFDFSLGNPDLKPPTRFDELLIELLREGRGEGHGYMPNAGHPSVRKAVADYLTETVATAKTGEVLPEMVIMTVGAAGAMNVILKTILDPGENVVVLAPYFMEYNFYIENHGGQVKAAQTTSTFRPDPVSLAETIDSRTRAVLINSPNNPTGVVYSKDELSAIAEVLARKRDSKGRPIYLIADEPYKKIVFGVEVPSVFESHPDSIIVNSFSKDLSIPGERLGYIALSPAMEGWEEVASAAAMVNRILGFVNAPSLMQRVVPDLLRETVDVDIYRRRVELVTRGLKEYGYELPDPQGTFYLFPKSPLEDDKAFVEILKSELILAVPGTGFGRRGYFRLSLCLDEARIAGSLPGFKRAMDKAKA